MNTLFDLEALAIIDWESMDKHCKSWKDISNYYFGIYRFGLMCGWDAEAIETAEFLSDLAYYRHYAFL